MFYNVDHDKMSQIELVHEIRLLGYLVNSKLWYKLLDSDLNSRLVRVEFDQSMLEMFDLFSAYQNDVIDLFMKQEGDGKQANVEARTEFGL